MGGGTGTGAAPIIAQVARELGALTVGVVTKPFSFEGSQRRKKAMSGIAELGKAVDALITIPNDRLVTLAGIKMTLKDAFAMVDNVLLNAVRGISDLVMVPGLINVDFADVRTIMTGMGRALMGTGRGKGEKRALEAAQQAISSPLLEDVSINGATGILINITGGPDLTLSEVTEAATLIEEAADRDANIIFGSVIDAHAGDEVRITLIATGFQPAQQDQPLIVPSRNTNASRRITSDQMALPMSPSMGGQPPHAGMSGQMGSGSRVAGASGGPSASGSGGTAPWPAADEAPAFANPHAQHYAQPPMPAYMHPGAQPHAQPGMHDWQQGGGSGPVEFGAEAMEIIEDVSEGDVSGGYGIPGRTSGMGMPTASATPDWGQQPSSERPIIRPPVGASPAMRGRASGSMGRVAGTGDEIGVEDSELDRPTFIRRGILPPG